MADLKPIGSEKLSGQDKIQRILEIARYNETVPKNLNETSNTEFSIPLADGSEYQIVKEKQGYVIKKNISESVTEYIEPMKNRKYYPSYSQALKRLNLLAKEINRLNENDEGVELFGEQKKFVLKTPKPKMDEPEAVAAPSQPPSVPSPELPSAPEAGLDMGPEETSPSVDIDMTDDEVSSSDGQMDIEAGKEDIQSEPSQEMITFKTIQKLTGRLTQKIRDYDNQDGMTSEDIKYVINMVLSALDLKNLSDEDKEDIMAKFEQAEERTEEGSDSGAEEDITSDTEVKDIQADMDIPVDQEMGEGDHGMILNNVYQESKVDKVLSKYFEISKKEILEVRERKGNRKIENQARLEQKMKSVSKFTESLEQETASRKFLEENFEFNLIGKTNKKNLVFENSEKQVKITPEGFVV